MKTKINIEKLWKSYKNNNNSSYRNILIEYYQPFIKKIVKKVYFKMPNYVDVSDLESYANIGLIDALSKFDPERKIRFEAYATIRIKGAIIDGIRKQDWLKKTLRGEIKKEEQEEILNEDPGNGGLKKDSKKRYVLMSLDDPKFIENNNYSKNEYQNIENEGLLINTPDFADKLDDRMCLLKAVSSLNKKEKKIVYLYYFKGRTFKEIGKMMQITESRVSQIHKKTLKKLKKNLENSFPFVLSLSLVMLLIIKFSLFYLI